MVATSAGQEPCQLLVLQEENVRCVLGTLLTLVNAPRQGAAACSRQHAVARRQGSSAGRF